MPPLPQLKSFEVKRILEREGFLLHHQKGSHAVFKKGRIRIVVPMHRKVLGKGLLMKIYKRSDIPLENFKL